MNDALLIQCADGVHAHLLNLTVKDHAAYCADHEIDYWPVYGSALTGPDAGRHAFWNKVALIRKGLAAGYRYVVWLDADCYIADTSRDIREACPADGLGLVWHGKPEWPEGPECYSHFNCGAVYVGNGPDAERLMKCWWKSPDDGHCWHDQHAFNQHAIPAFESLMRRPAPVTRLGLEWNSVPFAPFTAEKPIVAAWHGYEYDIELRHAAMQAFIASNTLRRMLEGCTVDEARQKADFCAEVGNYEGAVAFFERAAELGAADAEFFYRYAQAYTRQFRHADAIQIVQRGIEADPDNGLMWQLLGTCYDFVGEHELNGHAVARAAELCPNHPVLMHNASLWHLRDGDWVKGFDLMKWSFLCRERIARYPGPEWDGAPSRLLYIWSEQGLGDTIMLCRYVPRLNERKVFEVQKPLASLLAAQCWPGVEIVARPDNNSMPWRFDAHVGTFTLPKMVGATVENTTGRAYLKAPVEKVQEWRGRLRTPIESYDPSEINIGFSWAGSAAHGNNVNRNAEARLFNEIVKTPGTRWFSLQRDIEIPEEARETTPEVTWIGDEFEDMADTAGALANMDLVITVDSAILHLCGALGVPCWGLISKSSDWRWLTGREDTVWYQSVRLFRQSTLGAWDDVMRRVDEALKEFMA